MLSNSKRRGSHEFSLEPEENLLSVGNKPVRASSFRSDREKPQPKPAPVDNYEGFFAAAQNFCSSPNLRYPEDDTYLNVTGARDENHQEDVPLRRVRSFKTTSKGIVHRGDSFRKKAPRSGSTGVVMDHNNPQIKIHNGNDESVISLAGAGAQTIAEPVSSYFKVLVAGGPGTGKSSLIGQFMNTEFADSFDDDGTAEKTVTIQLDGYEAAMEFIDYGDFVDDGSIEDLNYDAYIVIYSVTDNVSFNVAGDWIHKLRHGRGTDRPIMLVGNKIDLVRKRKVTIEDARELAKTYDCKLWETSATLSHHIDDLEIALLKRIRNKLNPELYPDDTEFEPKFEKKKSFKGPKEFIRGLFRRYTRKRKSRKK
ncbi:hypothetical protein CHS0354_033878 [Potamilus streckersoni]|uniref:Uncharacterized protein n=1 Tax=Potamilus streckersoni TaxID=2493646 RepID=A0AAE0RX53_9BIVA|nr:hypothetical protein CHS0354_033878 [Potamilus streckersoni]